MSRTVFATPWFQVDLDDRYVIHETNGQSGAAVLASDSDGRILLLDIDRAAIGRRSLEAPRGMAEDGETAVQAAMREFHEETGIALAPEALRHVGECAPNTGLASTRVQLFIAGSNFPFRPGPAMEPEIRDSRLMTADEVVIAVSRGEIICGITLSLVAHWLARGS